MVVKMVRLNDLTDSVVLIRGFPTERTRPSGKYPVLSVADLRNGGAPRQFVDTVDLKGGLAGIAVMDDILIAVEGGTSGESFIVDDQSAKFVPSQQAMTLRVEAAGVLDPWYLAAWLTSDEGRANLAKLTRGAGIQRIALRDLLSLEVRVPPMQDQVRIGGRHMAFQRSLRSHRQVMTQLEELMMVDADLEIMGLARGRNLKGELKKPLDREAMARNRELREKKRRERIAEYKAQQAQSNGDPIPLRSQQIRAKRRGERVAREEGGDIGE